MEINRSSSAPGALRPQYGNNETEQQQETARATAQNQDRNAAGGIAKESSKETSAAQAEKTGQNGNSTEDVAPRAGGTAEKSTGVRIDVTA